MSNTNLDAVAASVTDCYTSVPGAVCPVTHDSEDGVFAITKPLPCNRVLRLKVEEDVGNGFNPCLYVCTDMFTGKVCDEADVTNRCML